MQSLAQFCERESVSVPAKQGQRHTTVTASHKQQVQLMNNAAYIYDCLLITSANEIFKNVYDGK